MEVINLLTQSRSTSETLKSASTSPFFGKAYVEMVQCNNGASYPVPNSKMWSWIFEAGKDRNYDHCDDQYMYAFGGTDSRMRYRSNSNGTSTPCNRPFLLP